MGFGFLKSVYEKCLLIEMRKADLEPESQKPITVYYDGEVVGEFFSDIIKQFPCKDIVIISPGCSISIKCIMSRYYLAVSEQFITQPDSYSKPEFS